MPKRRTSRYATSDPLSSLTTALRYGSSSSSVPQQAQAPRHPEVNQENPTRFEPNNQILAAALQGGDSLAFELGRDLARIVGPGQAGSEISTRSKRAPDEVRLEPGADRLDLWQLGHAASVATRLRPRSASRARSDAAVRGSLRELDQRPDLVGCLLGARVVARVDLGERLALLDGVAPLREAEDADGVVDRVLLRPPSGAELERRAADAERGDALRRTRRGRRSAPSRDRRVREHLQRGVAALGRDPALVRRERGPVVDRALRSARAPPRRRCRGRRARADVRRLNRERERGREALLAASSGDASRISSALPTAQPERLVHVGQERRRPRGRRPARARASPRRAPARPRASS